MSLTVLRPTGVWTFSDASLKLSLRASLPGAYGYDLAAHGIRIARARSVPVRDLLPLAMPTSWMVNNRCTSPIFRRWLLEQSELWCALVDALDIGTEAWLDLDEASRDGVTAIVKALTHGGHGVCAISKVLALLCPHTVPLMDDAALHVALGVVPMPSDAENPSAGAEHFVPMLDWFARSVTRNERALAELARTHRDATLDAAQCLDRLLWVDAWGWRVLRGSTPDAPRFWWLFDDGVEGIAHVEGPHPTRAPTARVDLGDATLDEAWRTRARAALRR